jgi:GAF domain-containing protein
MEYRFIHHWQYTLGEEESDILEAAIALANQEKDETFFQEVAAFIARHTGVQYIVIGLLSADKKQIHTCACQKGEQILSNITYDLQGSPCEKVLIHRFCYYPLRVSQTFPHDAELQQLQIESYLGTILLSDANEPLGLITLMDTKRIKNAAFAEHLILVLSSGIEEELMKHCNACGSIAFNFS